MLTTFVVTNTNDSGAGSLRQAITDANNNPGADSIEFNIEVSDPGFSDVDSSLDGGDSAPDVFVIPLASPLPPLADATGGITIDATTQTSFGGDRNPFGPEIVLDGSAIGTGNGIRIASDGNVVEGLNIENFSLNGIMVDAASNNRILGNHVGTDPTGHFARSNGLNGILFINGATGNRVGGVLDQERNILSGNRESGILLIGSETAQNVIQGNYIGTDADGLHALPNVKTGVDVRLGSSNNTIGGTVRNIVSGNGGDGIQISGGRSNRVFGNYIGTDVTGQAPLGNQGRGVRIARGATHNWIGTNGDGIDDDREGNVVSANVVDGIFLVNGASSNVIAGNLVGTDVTGETDLGNGGHGVRVGGGGVEHNLLGTNGDNVSDGLERNLISGNSHSGVSVQGAGGPARFNTIAGNFIGTDVTGTTAIPNDDNGVIVWINSVENLIGTDADGVADATEGNIISGNKRAGIVISGDTTTQNTVAGNYVGTNVAGDGALGNGLGIVIESSDMNLIGTNGDSINDRSERNIVSSNAGTGITVSSANENVIAGNVIGADESRRHDLGNGGHGVFVRAGSIDNLIGGTRAQEGNAIAFNSKSGIAVADSGSTGNRIRRNVIFSNSMLGIDLIGGNENAFGVTANDTNDSDSGPNGLQNFPILNRVGIVTGGGIIEGTLQSVPNSPYLINVYRNESPLDPSGFGEGQLHLGQFSVTTDSSGLADFSHELPLLAGEADKLITATATDRQGNTSEFAAPVIAAKNHDPEVNVSGRRFVDEGDTIVLQIDTFDRDGDHLEVSLENAPAGAQLVSGEGGHRFVWTAGDGQFPRTEVSASVRVTDDGLPQASTTTVIDLIVYNVAPTIEVTQTVSRRFVDVQVAVRDASVLDESVGSRFSIHWGDGRFDADSAFRTITQRYIRRSTSATFNLHANATDKDGARVSVAEEIVVPRFRPLWWRPTRTGDLGAEDINALFGEMRAEDPDLDFDLTDDGLVDDLDRDVLVEEIMEIPYGDANTDGLFDRSDLVATFQAGHYEDDGRLNSTWQTGDWDGNGEFDILDLVLSLVKGSYQTAANKSRSLMN